MRKVVDLAEGPTEERFIKEAVNPELEQKNLYLQPVIVAAKRVNTGGKFKGGVPSYEKVRKELLNLLGDSSALVVITMLDFYGLPESFPGRANPQGNSPLQRVAFVENAWSTEINNSRFYPYLSLHEFEALLFVSPKEIADGFARSELLQALERIRQSVATPEDINDNPD